MTQSQRRYVVVETAISVVINALISVAFVFMVFGGTARVPVAALIPDAIPQSFMIALMGTIVPTLLTRKRVQSGTVTRTGGEVPKLLKSLPIRALLGAFVSSITGYSVHAALLSNLAPDGLTFDTMLIFKATYGAILAAIISSAALHVALAERQPE